MIPKTPSRPSLLVALLAGSALCVSPVFAQEDDDLPPAPIEAPPISTAVLGIDGAGGGLSLDVVWGDEVGPFATVTLRSADGHVIAAADAQPQGGAQVDLHLPLEASTLASGGWRYDLTVDDGRGKSLYTVDVGLDCGQARNTCSATFELGSSRTTAISASAELQQALEAVRPRSDGRTNLVEAVSNLDPALRGEALRYSDEVARSSRRSDDCECYWTQNGTQGFKLPTPANNLLAYPSSETMAFGLEGPGAVLVNGAFHHGRTFTGTRDLTTDAEGSTLRKVDIDCFKVIEYEIIIVEIDLNDDGIIDFYEEVEVPSKWGPCENSGCEGRVEVLAQGTAVAYTYTWNRGLFVTAESWADAWLDLTLQGTNAFSLHATANARKRDDELDIDEKIHFDSVASPVCLEFEADSRSRVRGRARDINYALSTTSYAYALYGNEACVQNNPLISFEVSDYMGFSTDFCNNIVPFYATNGETVTCP